MSSENELKDAIRPQEVEPVKNAAPKPKRGGRTAKVKEPQSGAGLAGSPTPTLGDVSVEVGRLIPATNFETKRRDEEVENLREAVARLTQMVESGQRPKAVTSNRRKKREFEATVRLHEGFIVTKLESNSTVPDSQTGLYQTKFFAELLHPKTKEVTRKEINLLNLLNNTPQVRAHIDNWERTERYEVERSKGGGGWAPVMKPVMVNGQVVNEVVGEPIPYEVCFVDNWFTLTITEGELSGFTFENDGGALNF